ncbi:FUSC family protein [Enterococcus diestrammenae]|uniref:FUSC family protein n=1 Tax=Enterococcus diestrammenae TaxID=1155073 RepID=UPI001F86D18C|nr:aromatic acid exporter family protein [Enterococcus diestrammenae]HIX70519.1 FUSC family protein [Candidatus Enterococcus stercoravium]
MQILGLRFGFRNIKTGVSVFLCILISFLLQRETYVVACITAIFTIRDDHVNTVRYGKHRIMGNTFGAIASMICIFIFKTFGQSKPVQLVAIPLVIMLIIALLARFDYHEGTVGACATLLTILFMIPSYDSYHYAFNRVIDSIIGMFIAIAVNRILPTPETCEKAPADAPSAEID